MDQKYYFQYLGIRLDEFEVYTKTKIKLCLLSFFSETSIWMIIRFREFKNNEKNVAMSETIHVLIYSVVDVLTWILCRIRLTRSDS